MKFNSLIFRLLNQSWSTFSFQSCQFGLSLQFWFRWSLMCLKCSVLVSFPFKWNLSNFKNFPFIFFCHFFPMTFHDAKLRYHADFWWFLSYWSYSYFRTLYLLQLPKKVSFDFFAVIASPWSMCDTNAFVSFSFNWFFSSFQRFPVLCLFSSITFQWYFVMMLNCVIMLNCDEIQFTDF